MLLTQILSIKEKPSIAFFVVVVVPKRSFDIMQRSKLKFGQSKFLIISLRKTIAMIHIMKLQCRNSRL